MIGLLRLWYKSKKLKYSTYTMTFEDLTNKFIDDMDGLTLPELVQYHYMVKENMALAALATYQLPSAVDKAEEAAAKAGSVAGQYL